MSNHVTGTHHIRTPDPTPSAHNIRSNESGADSGAGEPDHNETKKEGMHL